jgi:Sulfotransferase family.
MRKIEHSPQENHFLRWFSYVNTTYTRNLRHENMVTMSRLSSILVTIKNHETKECASYSMHKEIAMIRNKAIFVKFPKLYQFVHSTYIKLRGFWRAVRNVCKHGHSFNRKYFVLDDKKLIYVANSKVASSSIKASMMKLEPQASYHTVHVEAKKSNDVLNIRRNEYPGYFRFTFVRNPFRRVLSCYENKFHTDKKTRSAVSPDMYFDDYLLGYIKKDRGFASFVRRVSRIPKFISDRHFVSQSYLLSEKGVPSYDFWGKMEDLPDAYEPIREKYDLATLPHYNKSTTKNWMDFYDEKTALIVYKMYERDIKEFGYEEEAQKLLDYVRSKKS